MESVRRRPNCCCARSAGGRGAPTRRCTCGRQVHRTKRPETFSLDRLQTPIGTAMSVTDADGVLRAFDWEDYASRMNGLLRLQYGAVVLQDAPAPEATRAALSAYFKGDLAALRIVRWRVAGTPFQRKV